jgi:hypothetical protein
MLYKSLAAGSKENLRGISASVDVMRPTSRDLGLK